MDLINDLKDIFELATTTTTFVKGILDLKPNNKNSEDDEIIVANKKNSAKIGSSGDYAQIGSSGYYAQIGSSGNSAKIGSSGYSAQIGSSGDSAKIGSSGDSAQIGSSGNSAKIGSSGYSAKIGSSGDYAQIGSSGNSAKIGSSGYYAKIDSTGEKAVISGIGFQSIVKAKKGSWITLAEYEKDDNNNWVISFVKTEYVDGERIKEDTWYILQNKEFQECVYIDGIISLLVEKRKNVFKVKNLGEENISYIVKDGDLYSHGSTIKEAKDGLLYKISNRDTSKYEDFTKETVLTLKEAIEMYRVITGACEPGTKYFIEQKLTDKKEKYTVQEVITLTQGQYNHNLLVEFFARA